jgi:hypothetical protein
MRASHSAAAILAASGRRLAMPEQLNVEVAHKLSEHEQAARDKRRWEQAIEILEVVLLAAAAIATAWSGYQAAKGDGQQSVLYSDASVDRVQANTAATLGQQRLAADGAMFSAWLEARAANDTELQAMLVRRFSPEYRTAFAAWLDTKPFTNQDALPGPGFMTEYHNPQMEQAEQLNEQAATLEEAGTEARHTAEEYVRATVLFALVLFLVAVGQRFRLRGVRIATIVMAFGLLGYGLYDLATLPPI